MKLGLATLALMLAACAGPRAGDPAARTEHTLSGFREANASVAALLDDAAAWAVFSEVEDVSGGCAHAGVLYDRAGDEVAVRLSCRAAPEAPAGLTYHALVVLLDPNDVAALAAGSLELTGATHLSPHDAMLERGDATRFLITSRWNSLLFQRGPPDQVLERMGD